MTCQLVIGALAGREALAVAFGQLWTTLRLGVRSDVNEQQLSHLRPSSWQLGTNDVIEQFERLGRG